MDQLSEFKIWAGVGGGVWAGAGAGIRDLVQDPDSSLEMMYKVSLQRCVWTRFKLLLSWLVQKVMKHMKVGIGFVLLVRGQKWWGIAFGRKFEMHMV